MRFHPRPARVHRWMTLLPVSMGRVRNAMADRPHQPLLLDESRRSVPSSVQISSPSADGGILVVSAGLCGAVLRLQMLDLIAVNFGACLLLPAARSVLVLRVRKKSKTPAALVVPVGFLIIGYCCSTPTPLPRSAAVWLAWRSGVRTTFRDGLRARRGRETTNRGRVGAM